MTAARDIPISGDPACATLGADWLTIVQSEMRALADDREVREAQAAALDRVLDDGHGTPGRTVPGPDAPAGPATAGDAPGARDDAGGNGTGDNDTGDNGAGHERGGPGFSAEG